MSSITARQARQLVADYLTRQGIATGKVTARTVSFADLARGSRVFVTVAHWPFGRDASAVEALATGQGFSVEFKA